MKKIIIFLFAGCYIFALQEAGLDDPLLDLGLGARPQGMGNAFIAIADDANAVYWNSAGLVSLSQSEITCMYTPLFEWTKLYYLSYGCPIHKGILSNSGFGISWLMITSGDILHTEVELTKDNRYKIDDKGNVIYHEDNDYDYVSNAVLIGYGKEIGHKFSLGSNIKLNYKTHFKVNAKGIGSDLGLLYKPIPSLNLGIVVQDIGTTKIKWDTGITDKIPMNLKFGIAWKILEDKLDKKITIATELEQKLKRNYHLLYHLGVEWKIVEALALRLGYDEENITAGVSFIKFPFNVDYAYVGHEELNNTHRLSLTLKF